MKLIEKLKLNLIATFFIDYKFEFLLQNHISNLGANKF